MTQERTIPANGNAPKSVEPGKVNFSKEEIPPEIKAFINSSQSSLQANANIVPSRQNAGYKGDIVLATDKYLVQAVGKENKTAVVHKREDVEFVSQNHKFRAENGKRLDGLSVQIHYPADTSKAKAYPYSADKSPQEKQESSPAKQPEAKVDAYLVRSDKTEAWTNGVEQAVKEFRSLKPTDTPFISQNNKIVLSKDPESGGALLVSDKKLEAELNKQSDKAIAEQTEKSCSVCKR
ncbi:KfrB domain-containing protein [Iodobacter fluviatilis]|uniref:KfrB domain-containing protein n=1 Tax=Iodobacter fluviatilis TaxID=537 RepID=A0A7G3GF95_9NEIS|nr:hypothetical protein [Iodobacter fluviatilis]QBC45898.1 hypothetical protein C1H71_20360 [Iodobacter fluviatilis]